MVWDRSSNPAALYQLCIIVPLRRHCCFIFTLSPFPPGPIGSQLLTVLCFHFTPQGPHKQGTQRQTGLWDRRGAEAWGFLSIQSRCDWDGYRLTFSFKKMGLVKIISFQRVFRFRKVKQKEQGAHQNCWIDYRRTNSVELGVRNILHPRPDFISLVCYFASNSRQKWLG